MKIFSKLFPKMFSRVFHESSASARALSPQFWKICPMEHILVRLESDSLPVSRRLVGLVFSSFLPVNQPEEVWCERCVALLQMNGAAARRFYQHAHEHTACANIGARPGPGACPGLRAFCARPRVNPRLVCPVSAKLIHVIRHCLNACIRRALSACGEDEEERGKENASVSGAAGAPPAPAEPACVLLHTPSVSSRAWQPGGGVGAPSARALGTADAFSVGGTRGPLFRVFCSV